MFSRCQKKGVLSRKFRNFHTLTNMNNFYEYPKVQETVSKKRNVFPLLPSVYIHSFCSQKKKKTIFKALKSFSTRALEKKKNSVKELKWFFFMIFVRLKKVRPKIAINNNCKPFWMSSRKYSFSFYFFSENRNVALKKKHTYRKNIIQSRAL